MVNQVAVDWPSRVFAIWKLGQKSGKCQVKSVRLLALAARCDFGRVFYAASSFS